MKKRNMKKLMSVSLATVLAMSILSGCGNKTEEIVGSLDSSKPEGKTEVSAELPDESQAVVEDVSIKIGIWPEDTLSEDITMHEGYVDTMKELHPNVTCVPAYYKYSTDTFMPMVESGNCPTIFETWFTEPQKLIKAGAVADITDILTERGWLDKMNPAVRDLLSDADGNVYGIPRDGYALGLMLNVELFEEAGLVDGDGYPLYPKTWSELAETAQTIKEKTGSSGLCLLAKDNAGGWHFSNIAWAFGATLCIPNEDGTFTSNLVSDEMIAAMEYIKSLKWTYDVLTADPTNEDWGTGFTQLGTGASAMYIAANDAVNQPTQVNGLPVDKLAMCPIPAGDAGQFSLYGGTPYMFAKDATEAEINAALDYIEIMGRAPVVSDASIAGLESDAKNRVNNGVPVIKPFPCWTDSDYVAAQAKVVTEYGNVDSKMYQSYFDATSSEGLHVEEPGLTQDMYAELTKVMQAVIVDKNADVASLLEIANSNYQLMLDDAYQK